MAHADAFVTLARLLRPQGRKGELLADLLTDSPGLLAAGSTVFLVPPTAAAPLATATRIAIESDWLPVGKNAGRIVLKLPGTDSISDAEKLAGFQLMLPAAERPALDPDTFYIADLTGCTLFDGETPVGTVVDLEFATTPDGKTRLPDAAPLLVVHLTGNDEDPAEVLIPFVRAQLDSVDLPNRRITMHLPEGLLTPDA